jgi:preprotein translocase subunit SecE
VAEDNDNKKVRRVKKVESVRQRAEKAGVEKKPRRIVKTAGTVAKPLKAARRIGQKEYYLPLPQNKASNFLNKRRNLFPRFFINAWRELRGVTWPSRRETFRLTVAVLMFAIVFGLLIAVVDYGLDIATKQLLLK